MEWDGGEVKCEKRGKKVEATVAGSEGRRKEEGDWEEKERSAEEEGKKEKREHYIPGILVYLSDGWASGFVRRKLGFLGHEGVCPVPCCAFSFFCG